MDAKVTPDEFIDYYNIVSAIIDDDKHFELVVNNVWNLNSVAFGKAGKQY